ncbi:unnamed protein product [Peniophora sp. CBMAI 1063]|nr:unnamed protein product [Peniophora sp. CBMAI 1063]
MKFSAAGALVALPAFAYAHADHHHVARQVQAAAAAASTTGSAAASSASSAAASGTSAAASAAGTTAAAGSANTDTTLPASWLSTGASALPLASINSAAASAATQALPTPQPSGTKNSHISNAPGLPDASTLVIANYPALDKTPDTSSTEVQQWIAEVAASGVQIPDIEPTVAGGCAANAAAAADKTRCWWTCGGCTNGTDVEVCPTKNTWGLTYDDGPAPYTPDLLDYLAAENLTATFYTVGSRVLSYPGLLQREYLAGHDIAVHTWAHPYLTTLTNEQIIAELGWTKKVIKDVLGVTPLYMRPPYGDIDNRVRAIAKAMNLIPVMWTRISETATFDTADYDVHGGTATVGGVLQNWENILANASSFDTGFIVLEHDLFQQTVEIATGYILPDALAYQPKLTIEPIITCLGLELGDAYIETNDNSSNPLPLSATAAPSGTKTGSASGAQATGGSSNSDSSAAMRNVGSAGVLAATALLGAIVLFA